MQILFLFEYFYVKNYDWFCCGLFLSLFFGFWLFLCGFRSCFLIAAEEIVFRLLGFLFCFSILLFFLFLVFFLVWILFLFLLLFLLFSFIFVSCCFFVFVFLFTTFLTFFTLLSFFFLFLEFLMYFLRQFLRFDIFIKLSNWVEPCTQNPIFFPLLFSKHMRKHRRDRGSDS